ncbi:MAG: NAD(P)H-dependent oxidoreductase [Clostridiales bacterium]|nr:NAD(P)H-dependent oxidoreductase [Clostridiales bacterium]
MANLIVYYSRAGENISGGRVTVLEKGNTEIVAEYVKMAVGGDLFEVDTVKPYSTDYYKCIDEAKKELILNARPAIKGYLKSIDKYDTIFVCYPNWWGHMPMCMCTFLEHYDWTGKRIVPICTNEGSGMSNSERQLNAICRGATVVAGLSIIGSECLESEAEIALFAMDNA